MIDTKLHHLLYANGGVCTSNEVLIEESTISLFFVPLSYLSKDFHNLLHTLLTL